MGIELLSGVTGDGKSYIAVTEIIEHLRRGGVVGCNFHLVADWHYRLAQFFAGKKQLPQEDLLSSAWSLYSRCYLVGRPRTIKELADVGPGLCVPGSPAFRSRENKVLLVLDEVGLYMSPTTFKENLPWLQLFTQSRKLKLHCLLLGHHGSYLDNKIRKLLSYESRAVNLSQHYRIPGTSLGWPPGDVLPQIPRPTFFRARKGVLGGGRTIIPYRFRPEIAALYNTDEIFDFDTLPAVLEHQGSMSEYCPSVARAQRPALPSWPWSDRWKDGTCTWLNIV